MTFQGKWPFQEKKTFNEKHESFLEKLRNFQKKNKTPPFRCSSSSQQNRQTSSTAPTSQLRKLVAFDFDHTVVNDNTDVVVRDLLDKSFITPEIQQLHKDGLWTEYMQRIFRILHSNGYTKAQIQSTIEAMPEVTGLKELIRQLHATDAVDVIIVSDSNGMFIKCWCDYNGITECFKSIFTNPAEFDATGLLQIQPFQHQAQCTLSSVNLCKGDVLEQFVKRQADAHNVIYDKIFYVGDGGNDFCPILRLGMMDFGLARQGFQLQKRIRSAIDSGDYKIEAKPKFWVDGDELKQIIFDEI